MARFIVYHKFIVSVLLYKAKISGPTRPRKGGTDIQQSNDGDDDDSGGRVFVCDASLMALLC